MNEQISLPAIPVTVEHVSEIKLKLTVTIPMDEIDKKVFTELKEIARKVKIPGFRPGRVPFDLVKKKYETTAREEVIGKEIKKSYFQVLEQEKLNPIGLPQIELATQENVSTASSDNATPTATADSNGSIIATDTLNKNFVYHAFIEVAPEISLVDLTQINAEKLVATVTEEDVNEMLEKIRKEKTEWVEVTKDNQHQVQKGDKVLMEFYMKLYGDTPDKVVREEQDDEAKFTVGSGEMWQEFEEHLLNKSIGESVTFNLTFPATHVDKDVANKNAEFNVKIKQLWEARLPPLDEEFAIKCNIKEGGIEALRNDVRHKMETSLKHILQEKFHSTIIDKLATTHSFEVPKGLVENEIDKRQEYANHQLKRYIAEQKIDKQKIEKLPRELFEPAARKSVINSLLLARIAEINNIKVAPQQLRVKVEEIAASHEKPEDVVNWLYSNERSLKEIEMTLLSEMIFDYLQKQITITEKPISYKEAMELDKNH